MEKVWTQGTDQDGLNLIFFSHVRDTDDSTFDQFE
jgi:hypothetical protein